MYAYFDIGGTKTRVAVSTDGEEFGEPVKFDTLQDFDEEVATIATHMRELSGGEQIVMAGGGLAGPLNKEKTGLVYAPNVPEPWVGRSLVDALGTALEAPVVVENDTAIVGLGESHYGAGKGDEIMGYLTISTGIGGVRIVDGSIDRNVYGFEPGHQILDLDATRFPILAADDAEEMLSGTAIAKRFHKKAYEVTDPAVWEELAQILAYLVYNTVLYWSPTSVVLGGSMVVGNPAIPVDRTEHHLKEMLKVFPECPTIKKAELADMGGIYGAMAYVKQRIDE